MHITPLNGLYLIRGIPSGCWGDRTDFTLVAEPRGRTAWLHMVERLDTPNKYRRLRGALGALGFTQAAADRKGRIKRYRV